MPSKSATVGFEELLEAYEFASVASEVQAYICISTGKIYVLSNHLDIESDADLPADIETSDNYLCLPDKNDLGLGQDLVFSFVQESLPDAYGDVRAFFRKAGAYGRFKALLGSRGKLDEWYKFEEKATADTIREWCASNGLRIAGSEDQHAHRGNL